MHLAFHFNFILLVTIHGKKILFPCSVNSDCYEYHPAHQSRDLVLQEQTDYLTINEYHVSLEAIETKYNNLRQIHEEPGSPVWRNRRGTKQSCSMLGACMALKRIDLVGSFINSDPATQSL